MALAPASIPVPELAQDRRSRLRPTGVSCRRTKHLTLQLLWQEYREQQPDTAEPLCCGLMLPWDAGPQAFGSSTAPTATLINRVLGYSIFKNAIKENSFMRGVQSQPSP